MHNLGWMTVRERRRAAWATGVSLALHVLFLAGMVVGLRVAPLPEGDPPMQVSLIPALRPPPQPVRPPPTSERPKAVAPLRPHPTPALSVPVATLAPPEAEGPAPETPQQPQFGPGGLGPSLSGRLGCDAPLTYHLTPEQRQVCDTRMARLGREAKRLVPDIADKNKANYDRYVRCGETYRHAGVPPMNGYTPDGELITGPAAGLGVIPGECVKGLGQILHPQGAR